MKPNKKLTKWANEPKMADIRHALTEALPEFTAHESEVKYWLEAMNVSGHAAVKSTNRNPRSTIVPKLIRKHAEWRYASLSEPFHTSPSLFSVTPVSNEDYPSAEQHHSILAHQFRKSINRTKLIDDTVRTAVDEGTVIYRVGWDFRSKLETVLVDELDSLGQPTGRQVEQKTEVILKSEPTVDVVEYDTVIIDPNARGDMNDAKYVFYKYTSSLTELKAQKGKYKNLEDLEFVTSGSGSGSRLDSSTSFGTTKVQVDSFIDKNRKQFEVYEYWGYWDIKNNNELVPINVTFVGNTIIRIVQSPFPDRKLPFVLVHYLPVRNHNYGEPDGILLEDSQKIMGAVTRGMIDLLGHSANGQIGYKANALDAANMLKMQRGENYVFRDSVNPAEIAYQHTYPEIPQSALTMLAMQGQEAESLTGINTFGKGVSSASLGDTATGIRGALDGASKRESGMLRRLAAGLEEVARKVASMNEVFLEPQEVEAITNRPYVPPKGDGKLVDIEVKIRTAEADEKSSQDLAFLLQTTGSVLDPSFTQLLLSRIVKLQGMPDLAYEIENFKSEPTQQDIINQQLAQEKAIADVEKVKADAQKAQAEVQVSVSDAEAKAARALLDQAKAESEGVNAQKMAAETSRIVLENLEEETGTNHERQLDIVNAQAKSNMHLKSLEAKLALLTKTPDKKDK